MASSSNSYPGAGTCQPGKWAGNFTINHSQVVYLVRSEILRSSLFRIARGDDLAMHGKKSGPTTDTTIRNIQDIAHLVNSISIIKQS